MANSLVKMNIHIIFHIKTTSVLMHPDDLPQIFAYIGGILNRLDCLPIIVGGVSDHIHLLTSLSKTMSLADLMRLLKTNSSKWIKTLHPNYASFAWQDGYGAFSVSPSFLDRTIRYIQNQAQHHQRTSFEYEYKRFLDAYQISYDERFIFND